MKRMNRCLLLLILLGLMTEYASAQRKDAGSLQIYPAGFTLSYRSEWSIGSRASLMGTAGINLTDRHDWGRHDKESGGGVGIGAGLQHWLEAERSGWYWGGSLDAWLMSIEWSDASPARSGDTAVLVIQPAVKGGHSLRWRTLRIDLGAALGVEINTWTNDENVGQGAIMLLSLSVTR